MKECHLDIQENGCKTEGNLEGENNTDGYVAGDRTPSMLKVHTSDLTVATGHKMGPKNTIAFDIKHLLALNAMLI